MDGELAVAIRLAMSADADTVAAFSIACARESEGLALDAARTQAGVAAALRDPSRGRYYLAEDEAGGAGQIMITREWSDWRNAWMWWLQSVYVRPEMRRRGVFRALLRHVESVARNESVEFLRLYVDTGNARAERAYLDERFTPGHYRMLEKQLGPD